MKVLRFNRRIYNKNGIEKAVKDFGGLALFKIKKTKRYFEIFVSPNDKDFDYIFFDEFKNYCLGAVKKCF